MTTKFKVSVELHKTRCEHCGGTGHNLVKPTVIELTKRDSVYENVMAILEAKGHSAYSFEMNILGRNNPGMLWGLKGRSPRFETVKLLADKLGVQPIDLIPDNMLYSKAS